MNKCYCFEAVNESGMEAVRCGYCYNKLEAENRRLQQELNEMTGRVKYLRELYREAKR